MNTNSKSGSQDRPLPPPEESSTQKALRLRILRDLERAAYDELKLLDEDAQIFTPEELSEAEALRAEIDRLVARAEGLHHSVTERLSKEARDDPEKAAHLKRFEVVKGRTIKLPPF